jgi:hypothetical protein
MTQLDDTHGPGTQWLAERAGVSPEELLRDPVCLLRQLAQATRETAELVADTASPDPVARHAEGTRADQLKARLTEGTSPSGRFGTTVARALRDQAERLRPGD